MEEADYGKLLWIDEPSKGAGVWRTALLLLAVIFVMNWVSNLNVIYIVLAVAAAFGYIFFAIQPDRMSFRVRIYQNGIVASVHQDNSGGMSFPKEKLFPWKGIKSLRVEKRGKISKKILLHIVSEEGIYAARLENAESFLSACSKFEKKVEV